MLHLRLAQSHKRTRHFLQGTRVWNNLIKRCSPLTNSDWVGHLVAILKLMNHTKSNMVDLLDAICEANLHVPCPWGDKSVQMSCCPRHPDSHVLCHEGFLLLEKVEAAFGTTEQTFEAIRLGYIPASSLPAFASRLSWQQQKLTSSQHLAVGHREGKRCRECQNSDAILFSNDHANCRS